MILATATLDFTVHVAPEQWPALYDAQVDTITVSRFQGMVLCCR